MIAAEIRLRAKRRVGQLSKELDKAKKVGRASDIQLPRSGKSKAEALKHAGLTTSEAHRCEKLDSVPQEEFTAYIEKCRISKCVVSSDEITKRANF